MRTVRIQRKRKSDLKMLGNWGRFLAVCLNWVFGQAIAQQKYEQTARLQDAKLEEIQMRTRVQSMREIKLSNDIVIQEMKLEELKKELQARNILPPEKGRDGNAF